MHACGENKVIWSVEGIFLSPNGIELKNLSLYTCSKCFEQPSNRKTTVLLIICICFVNYEETSTQHKEIVVLFFQFSIIKLSLYFFFSFPISPYFSLFLKRYLTMSTFIHYFILLPSLLDLYLSIYISCSFSLSHHSLSLSISLTL